MRAVLLASTVLVAFCLTAAQEFENESVNLMERAADPAEPSSDGSGNAVEASDRSGLEEGATRGRPYYRPQPAPYHRPPSHYRPPYAPAPYYRPPYAPAPYHRPPQPAPAPVPAPAPQRPDCIIVVQQVDPTTTTTTTTTPAPTTTTTTATTTTATTPTTTRLVG